VKTFFLLTALDDYGRVRAAETSCYERLAPQLVTTPPAATLMVVPALSQPGLRAQYEVIAALDRSDTTYYPEFWGGRELAYPHVPKDHAKFARSQAVGELVIVSGCQALDHGTVRVETADVAEQSRIVLEKVRLAMEEAGGSLDSVAKTNVFVKDEAALATYREVERSFFPEPPASTAYVVRGLPRPEFLVEVEAFGTAGPEAAARRPGTGEAAESARAGDLLFLSGCAGATVDEALAGVASALARAGSSPDRIVRTTALLRDPADYPASGADTLVTVTAGPRVQLDVIAR
jgi:enamine deaminase RidA (YjgF/YER057c/UK114 family)